MAFQPLFVDTRSMHLLVVGGGRVAARKLDALGGAWASARVVAPRLAPALRGRAELSIAARPYREADLDGAQLVLACTDDRELNRRVVAACTARGVLVNSATESRRANVLLPASIERGPITVAVASGGAAPALTKLLRDRLAALLPASYARLAALLESHRTAAARSIPDDRRRGRFWAEVLEGPVAELVHAGRDDEAEAALRAAIACGEPGAARGEVWIVGAGPGDPELLSVRALRLIQQADLVVIDRLVSPAIAALVRPGTELLYAGKRRGQHTIAQSELNALLVERALAGQRVCRLKGGDPFIFGRGAEEIEQLVAAGVAFQVVPGITAASGCASYAGIPLTHREHAQSCVFVTGHRRGDGALDLDWARLAGPSQTLVFYMGLESIAEISAGLSAAGMAGDTPCALIQQGTTAHQRVLIGELGQLAADAAGLQPPALLIVGEVVRLYHRLRWYRTGADHVAVADGFFDRRGDGPGGAAHR